MNPLDLFSKLLATMFPLSLYRGLHGSKYSISSTALSSRYYSITLALFVLRYLRCLILQDTRGGRTSITLSLSYLLFLYSTAAKRVPPTPHDGGGWCRDVCEYDKSQLRGMLSVGIGRYISSKSRGEGRESLAGRGGT